MKRREFLTMAFGAALEISAAKFTVESARQALDFASMPEFQDTVKRFDRKSIDKKRQYLEGLCAARFTATRSDTQELADECNVVLSELQTFLQSRFEKQMEVVNG